MQTVRRIVAVLLVVAFMVTVFPMNSTELFAAVVEQNEDQMEDQIDDNSHITRAEWLHELVAVFDMTVESGAEPDNYFNDLQESHEYYNDVILAVEFGVVDVKEGESIYPDDFVTRDFAATTLNFCLGYQQTENDEYIFSDYEDCSSPFDALVAVEKGWLSLVDGKFMPQRMITEVEAKGMIEYAASVLNMTDIDAEYNSSYTFEEGIIVIPPEISVSENGDYITVEDCSEKIQPGDKFVVYINGIPNMYEAVSVEENGNVLTIQKTDVEYNDSVKDADAQGQVSSENMDFIAADGVEIEVEDEISVTPQKKITGLKSVRSSKRIKKNIKAKSTVTLVPGITASINVKINNPVVNYQILGNYSYVTLEGETEISYSVKGDLAEALGRKSITLFTCSVGGIGNFDVTAELSFSGSASGTVTGYLVAGIECRRGDRIRMVRSFQQKEYYCTVEAEASAGIKVALGATKLPVVNAYIYAEIGAKANLKSSYYTTEPKKCTHFAAYMYLKYGAYASVKFGGWKTSVEYNVDVFHDKNSPIRIVHHYENGIEVPSCTRGTVYSDFFTRWNSRYGGSGWSGYNGIYGLSSQGTQIPLYEYEKINDGAGIKITKYNGNSYYVSIPSTIDGLPVTSIGSSAFKGKSVVIVSIPDTVTNIGNSAFSGCTNLKTVNLPKSLTYLDAYAFENTAIESIEIPKSLSECGYSNNYPSYNKGPFYNCSKLKNVTFEKGITTIPNHLFAYCTGLETITIPDTVTKIAYYSFHNCPALTTVKLPDTVTNIGNSAFSGCTDLTDITIPNSVLSVGDYAFSGCSALQTVKLPQGVKEIVPGMFQKCTSMKTIGIPSSVTVIEKESFSGCSALESFSFENGKSSLRKICSSAFKNCSSLKEAILPETVESVYNGAFAYCTSLEKVYIPESTKELGTGGFEGDESLKQVAISDYSITELPSETFKDCPSLETVTLPKGLKKIGDRAFFNDTSLVLVTIPESVTSISDSAFSYPQKTTINGVKGSYAETFAKDGGFKFNDIGIRSEGISLVDGVENIVMDKGETLRLKFECYPENSTDVISVTSGSNCISVAGHDIHAIYSGDSVLTAAASSGVDYQFNVHVRTPSKIIVYSPASKLSYIMGESFDPTGLVVQVVYDDKSVRTVSDYTVSGFDSSAEGENTVVLSWYSAAGQKYSTSFTVNIVDPSPKLVGIYIKELPAKREYERKETLDLTGLSVFGTYTDGSSKEISGYTVSGYNSLKTGVQKITVSYNGFTAEFTVSVDPKIECEHLNTEITGKKDATCCEKGYTGNTICKDCGKTVTSGTEIAATGNHVDFDGKWEHDENGHFHTCYFGTEFDRENHSGGEATCSSVAVCEICGTSYGERNLTNHKNTEIRGKVAATCSKEGYSGDIYCLDCGEKIVSGKTVDKLKHNYKDEVVPPTFGKKGYTLHTCTLCGDTYKDNYTSYVPSETDPLIKVASVRGIVGNQVKVAVSLKNNPGIVSMALKLSYDENVLKLVNVEDCGVLGTQVHSPSLGTPYYLNWVNDTATTNFTANGDIVILTFEVLENAALGKTAITVSYTPDNYEIYDKDGTEVNFAVESGYVDVSDILIGDVNGDGVVNGKDRLLLTRWLANWPEALAEGINEAAADVNCDGKVNGLDRLILTRHLAHWEEYATLPYTK